MLLNKDKIDILPLRITTLEKPVEQLASDEK